VNGKTAEIIHYIVLGILADGRKYTAGELAQGYTDRLRGNCTKPLNGRAMASFIKCYMPEVRSGIVPPEIGGFLNPYSYTRTESTGWNRNERRHERHRGDPGTNR